MDILENFNLWLQKVTDNKILSELNNIKNNYDEIYDRFHKNIEFGTAGLRGIMGAGTNRMNIYTVRKVSQGFANYINNNFKNPSIVISYDSRHNSRLFAECTAEVMIGNNIKTYMTSELSPTPYLSFCVRNLNCSAGVMVTASHNTSEYNGYKCYDSSGSQITENISKEIYKYICNIDIFRDIKYINFDEILQKKLICNINNQNYVKYKNLILNQVINKNNFKNLNIMYTPLNGTGYKFVYDILNSCEINNIFVPEEQKNPDGNFTTCKYPNPEFKSAFDLCIQKANYILENNNIICDIIIATDPDADRLGVCVYYNNKYVLLTGNQIGLVLFYYIYISKKNKNILPENFVVIKSFVSTKLINSIAKQENFQVIEVPTGFKNIAQEILKLEQNNLLSKFIFGFEESNGYLCHTHARDKDAVSASLLLCEAVSYFKNQNLNLINILENLYKKYGYFGEKTISININSNTPKIPDIILSLNNNFKIVSVKNIYSSFVLELDNNHGEIIVRPSGTEPKIKIYALLNQNSPELLNIKLQEFENKIYEITKST